MKFNNITFTGEENINGTYYYVFETENYTFFYFTFNEDIEDHTISDDYGNLYTWTTIQIDLLNFEFLVHDDLDPAQENQRRYLDENQSKILKQICQKLI